MKKIILLMGLFFVFSVYAVTAPFSTAPAPQQIYHAVSSQAAQPAVATTVAQNTTAAPTVATTPNTVSTINTAGITLTSPAQNQTATISQPSNNNSQTQQEIQNLVDSDQAIGSAIQSIDQNIATLQQAVNQLELQQTHPKPAALSYKNIFHRLLIDVKTPMGLSISGFILLALGLLMGHWLIRRSEDRAFVAGTAAQNNHARRIDPLVDEESRNEYDFMGTREAIPSKLDLARSYMVMNDHDQAYMILKTVMEKGNDEQRTEAQLLIQKIIKKK